MKDKDLNPCTPYKGCSSAGHIFFFLVFVFLCFGIIPGDVQSLLLALRSGVTPGELGGGVPYGALGAERWLSECKETGRTISLPSVEHFFPCLRS